MIALCDQRSFYASCEGVFRPDIRDQPIAVLSNNDGCVVALNPLAKAVGVKKFEPYFMQRKLMESAGVHVFSSNYALYGEISARIMATLRRMTCAVEVYSIDEGFCDLSGIKAAELKPLGKRLRETVWREQRIPMGVSIAPTKCLAKLGQVATKSYPQLDGVAVLERSEQWDWLAKRVPVSEVWGVGRKLTTKLQYVGIDSAYDLLKGDVKVVKGIGGVMLERVVRELNGIPCIPMEDAPGSKQQIICSRSFGKPIHDEHHLLEAISAFAARASEKTRNQDSKAGRLSVWISYKATNSGRYPLHMSNSQSIAGGSSDSTRIATLAVKMTKTLYKEGFTYVKAGVGLEDLRPSQYWQRDLWSSEAESSAMDVLDGINRRYGRGTMHLGRQSGGEQFKMRQEMLSPRYLTRWQEIPKVSC